jgi:hypothetical protein
LVRFNTGTLAGITGAATASGGRCDIQDYCDETGCKKCRTYQDGLCCCDLNGNPKPEDPDCQGGGGILTTGDCAKTCAQECGKGSTGGNPKFTGGFENDPCMRNCIATSCLEILGNCAEDITGAPLCAADDCCDLRCGAGGQKDFDCPAYKP